MRLITSLHPRTGWIRAGSGGKLGVALVFLTMFVFNSVGYGISLSGELEENNLGNPALPEPDPSTSTTSNVGSKLIQISAVMLITMGVLPPWAVPLSMAVPGYERFPRFGIKMIVFFVAAVVLDIGQAARVAVAFNSPNDVAQPVVMDVMQGRAVFYVTGYLVDVLVVLLYFLARIDVLFHMDNDDDGGNGNDNGTENDNGDRSLADDIQKPPRSPRRSVIETRPSGLNMHPVGDLYKSHWESPTDWDSTPRQSTERERSDFAGTSSPTGNKVLMIEVTRSFTISSPKKEEAPIIPGEQARV